MAQIIHIAGVEIVDATNQAVLDAAKRIILKDAPIIAAKTANVEMLVSLDKKHILGRAGLETYINARIVPPITAYQKIRKQPFG